MTIDTLRVDRLGAYGYEPARTPAFDRLAARGTRFVQAAAHSPLTLPSHASILTGLNPPVHGIRDNATYVLTDEATTVAEKFQAAGYRTGAFVSSFILSAQFGLSQGFALYDDELSARQSVLNYDVQRTAAEVALAAARWLQKAAGQPFFAWVHFFDPHSPYEPPARFRDIDDPYDGEIAAADAGLQILLDSLEQAGVADRTIVVVTADHGEGLGDHGEKQHGLLLYDSVLRVPLVVVVPGQSPHVVESIQARHIDLAPTLLGLAGLKPGALPGADLRPFITQGDAAAADEARVPDDAAYAETWYGRLHFGWSELRAVRTHEWKLIEGPRAELYHLARDRGETRNLMGSRTAVAERLQAELHNMTVPPQGNLASTVPASSAALERLRALGYVGGGPVPGDDKPRRPHPADMLNRFERHNATLNDGIAQLEAANPAAATRLFADLVKEHPRSFEAHHYLGYAYAAAGRHQDAVREYDRALQLFPSYALAHFNAARALSAIGREKEALERLERGFALEPRSAYGQMVAGVVAWEVGDDLGAVAAFRMAVQLEPGASRFRANYAEALLRTGQYERALPEYELLVRAEYRPVEALFNIGVIFEKIGNPARAIATYREVLALQPSFEPAHRALRDLTARP